MENSIDITKEFTVTDKTFYPEKFTKHVQLKNVCENTKKKYIQYLPEKKQRKLN